MILRVFALYERNFRVLAFLMILWLLQIIISSIGLRTGFRKSTFGISLYSDLVTYRYVVAVPLPPGLTGKFNLNISISE